MIRSGDLGGGNAEVNSDAGFVVKEFWLNGYACICFVVDNIDFGAFCSLIRIDFLAIKCHEQLWRLNIVYDIVKTLNVGPVNTLTDFLEGGFCEDGLGTTQVIVDRRGHVSVEDLELYGLARVS